MVQTIRRYLMIAAGCLTYAISFNWFFAPNQIAFGGVTGLAQIINMLPSAPTVGVLIIIINVPLFLLGWRRLGWQVLASSLFAMAISSVFVDLTAALIEFPPMEPLLAALCGGMTMGLAFGFVFTRDATTGGTDLAALLLKTAVPWMPIARLLLILDLAIIALGGVVFQSLNNALYGLVALVVCTKGIDMVLYGMDTARVAYIISEKADEITAAILSGMDRGVTVLDGRGGWSGERKQVLFVAFKQRQIVDIRRIVKELDPAAFLIVCEAHEVLGEGFRAHTEKQM